MAELPLALGVVSLISTISKTSSLVASFVRGCRDARHDLEHISQELSSLGNLLSLLEQVIATTNDHAIPEPLQERIAGIISNCTTVLKDFDELLQRHNGKRIDQAACWAMIGKHDAAKLRLNLEAHRSDLSLSLDVLTQFIMRGIKEDTNKIRNDAAAIKQSLDRVLRRLLPAGDQGSNLLLEFSSYAEKFGEDRDDRDSENRRISKSSISSCDSQEPVPDTPSQEPVPDTPRQEPVWNIRKESGIRRFINFGNRRSSLYPMRLRGHDSWVLSVAFSPDGTLVASGSGDCTVKLWDQVRGRGRMTLEGHSSCVQGVAFSPDGTLLASASHDKTVRLWDVATGRSRETLKGHTDSVHAVTFSWSSNLVASSSKDCTVRLWDPGTGEHRGKLEGHTGPVWDVAISPDGNLVASASLDGTVKLWDPTTDRVCRTFEGHSDSVRAVAFSRDGRLIASGSHDQTVKLWEPATGVVRRTFKGHSDFVQAVALSPDGKLLASASLDNTVRLWDVATGRRREILVGHRDSIQAVTFSPDGKVIASSSNDRTVRLWDTTMAQM